MNKEKKKTPQQEIFDFEHACDELARQVNPACLRTRVIGIG